jgi:hypothetical protein
MNIYEKMAAITAELNAVAKNLKVGEGKSAYKAVGEADVLAAVKPLEAKHMVYSFPFSRRVIDSDVITTSKVYNGQESTSSKFFMRVETVYRFVNTENPVEYLDITTYGDGVDAGDKAPGKAMTYGDKYALLKAYKIITGDDPDQQYSEESKVTKGGYGYKEAVQNLRALDEYAGKPFECADCGCVIADGTKRNGEVWIAHDIASYTRKKFGRSLCQSCAMALASNSEGK